MLVQLFKCRYTPTGMYAVWVVKPSIIILTVGGYTSLVLAIRILKLYVYVIIESFHTFISTKVR